jgi:probable HAF family extracellular repeat protein
VAAGAPHNAVDLGTLGRPGTQAYGINASGQIVGEATIAAGQSHAFLCRGAGRQG